MRDFLVTFVNDHDKHNLRCPTPYVGSCKNFSTDGTRLGTAIAHQFGTMDEEEIKRNSEDGIPDAKKLLTGMSAEQREWEGLDDPAEADEEDDDGDF